MARHLARVGSRARALLLSAVTLPGLAFAGPPFQISKESVEASKPPGVAVISISATQTGARIVAYGFAPVEFSTFIRQLNANGAENIRLIDSQRTLVCERRIMRAEILIDGDSHSLEEVPPSIEPLRILLAGTKGSPECVSELLKGSHRVRQEHLPGRLPPAHPGTAFHPAKP